MSAELELLKAAARQRLAARQGVLDLGLDTSVPGGPLPITASRMGCLLSLEHAYRLPFFPYPHTFPSFSLIASWTARGCRRKQACRRSRTGP